MYAIFNEAMRSMQELGRKRKEGCVSPIQVRLTVSRGRWRVAHWSKYTKNVQNINSFGILKLHGV